ncbi:MAG: ECF transporter S component [Clostridia bacterium]|nr:ECF transporter S component [Clostridia bacterium]
MRVFSLVKRLVYTAVFAALCCIATWVVTIPLPYGYFNIGDVFVLLASWCLGPLYGGLAAGLGCALADVFSGYAIYAPATFVIKVAMAVVAYFLYALLKKLVRVEKLDFIPRAIAAIVAETVMLTGYFLFDSVAYGLAGGVAGLFGNAMQGAFCAFGGVILVIALQAIPFARKYFPCLKKE